jgi:hypothetical protein
MKKYTILLLVFSWLKGFSQDVVFKSEANTFPLVTQKEASPIYYDKNDFEGVEIAVKNLQNDIEAVTGKRPKVSTSEFSKTVVIIGTLGHSKIIDEMVQKGRFDTKSLKGKWEKFERFVVKNPMKGVKEALVIVGSDKRGTIYGIYDLSEKIGVSPWHFWADVPTKKHPEIYVSKTIFTLEEPKVKYRGIFLNDEAPCLSGWTHEKNGGFNQKLYTSIFELILRLKGNYLWPAMWGNAFHVDDSMNPVLADKYGVVIGTSHHEPLMRAHDEWRRYGKNKGPWDYSKNDSTLREFWRESVQQRYKYENIFSVGMRGDGDEPMSNQTATTLLEKIVDDQRKIIAEVSGKPASEKPQLWALYKEVQDYYDQGMRVPDDITLLLCDDNWGNIRKLPALDAKPRKGGYGIYYHFDYVGGPRNYKWVNTNPLPRIWEQMHLAYEYKAREIWIVNVGDLKPMELPISFFLDYAWNPEKIGTAELPNYTQKWAKANFGEAHSIETAAYLDKYAKYNARVKPELLNAKTYSLVGSDSEWSSVVNEYTDLANAASQTYELIEPAYKDAYYQLVLYPILACSNLYEMYYAQAQNQRAVEANWIDANKWADKVEAHFNRDQELSDYFNHTLAKGKWNHYADQTHIGYTYWQQPNKNTMPKVTRIESGEESIGDFPSVLETYREAPADFKGFIEEGGYVSMEAANFQRKTSQGNISWETIPDIGRTGDGVTIFPVNIPAITLNKNSPKLEYDMYWFTKGEAELSLILSPTLAFNANKGLKIAFSIDDKLPQILEIHADASMKEWENMVSANAKYLKTKVNINEPGKHTLKIWAMDPAVVLQKIVIDAKGLPATHLGPPESKIIR